MSDCLVEERPDPERTKNLAKNYLALGKLVILIYIPYTLTLTVLQFKYLIAKWIICTYQFRMLVY